MAVSVAGALALAASPCAAAGGKATNQFQATVRPTNSCTVAAAPLVFSIPVPTNTNVDSTTTVTVRCPPNTAFTIDIDSGLYPNGINRRVKNASLNAFINYDVYRDPPRSSVWGTGSAKNFTGNSGATGVSVVPVYGRVASVKTLQAGGYSDLLTVTLSF